MRRRIHTITLRDRNTLLHIETPNGIVNVQADLRDRLGRVVDSIEVIPSNYAGEPKVIRNGFGNTRLIRLKTRTNR